MNDDPPAIHLRDLALCFEGAVPAVVATAASDGTPNVTYLSRVRLVDDERLALSNQFLTKTARNLAENPRASILLLDPTNYDQYRLTLVYERTDRRGPLFDRLREDVEAIAGLTGMQKIFKLRAADIYRVVDIEQIHSAVTRGLVPDPLAASASEPPSGEAVAALIGRLSRCSDLDTLIASTVDGLDELLGYRHSQLLLFDPDAEQLCTIGSRGYGEEGIGAEVRLGDGAIGVAALRCAPVRIGNLRQMGKYAQSVRRSFESHGGLEAATTVPVPSLADAQSQLAVPAMSFGELVAVLAVESTGQVAFTAADEAALSTVAAVVANAIEAARSDDSHLDSAPAPEQAAAPPDRSAPPVKVRFFEVDGSVFLDSDYLIKGVAGRILWLLVQQFSATGRTEFTNKEVRLHPELELPEYRDNLESRLILLKRRLDERDAPLRIDKTGRGRFRLVVHREIAPEPG